MLKAFTLVGVLSAAQAGNPVATFDTTMGSFSAELYLDRVPRTASNFIDLAQSGFYNGLHFHRVIPGVFPGSNALADAS